MEKTKILLLGVIFALCLSLVSAEWESYGNNMYNEMKVATFGSSTDLNLTKSYTIGQSATTEPLIVSFGDPSIEYAVVQSSSGTISIINLVSHSVENSYSSGLTPIGQMQYNNGLFYGLYYDGAGIYFAEFNIDLSSLTQTGSILVQNGIAESGNSGLKCEAFSCVFQYNQSFYEVDTGILSIVYSKTVNESGNIISAKSNYANVPAIEQVSGDNIAYFTGYFNNNGYLCAYDITNDEPYNTGGFGSDGCKLIANTNFTLDLTTPMIMDFSGLRYVAVGINKEVFSGSYTSYNCLNLYDLSGTDFDLNCDVGGSSGTPIGTLAVSQQFYSKCKFGGVTDEGVGMFGYATTPTRNRFYFLDSNLILNQVDLAPVGSSVISDGQLSATADMDGNGIYEIVATIDNGTSRHTNIFTCNEGLNFTKSLLLDDNVYAPVISDFNGNGELDILLQRTGTLKEFGNIGTASIEVCGNTICGVGENIGNCPLDCKCGNGVCNSGETHSTCPSDCPVSEGNYSQLNLPTQLVDLNSANPLDPTQTGGLLPELYLGIMTFFKGSFIPFFLIMIFVMLVLLVFAFGKKVISKIG